MRFWEDLSGATKLYLVIAVIVIGLALALRSCGKPDASAPPAPRGYTNAE
jgi:hypothetical protein